MKLPFKLPPPRKADAVCNDISDAFALCRERDRPLVVELRERPDNLPVHGKAAKQFKVYPSGKAAWAFDGDNAFQFTWRDE